MEANESMPAFLFATVLVVISLLGMKHLFGRAGKGKYPPAVPGWPLIGNLLQLGAKKPYETFTEWARKYGPIYSIRIGAKYLVVINSSQLAKEAMVTKFSSISTRKLSNALRILTRDKTMVSMSDYGDFHHIGRNMIVRNLTGVEAQKQNHQLSLRGSMIQNIIDRIYSVLEAHSGSPNGIDIGRIFISEQFSFVLKQVLGRDVQSLYVEEIGTRLSKWEIYQILVLDPIKGAIEVDWRDFFPYLRWVPHNTVEENMKRVDKRRNAVLRTLIEDQKKFFYSSNAEPTCFLDILLKEALHTTDKELEMSIWEPIVAGTDTTLIALEWAMFHLSKNPQSQDRLYREIEQVCGNECVKEDDLPKLPFLSAVFQETLRMYPPVPILPLRYVHEEVEVGGFSIPAGSEIAINVFGCHNYEREWKSPEEWKPERFKECERGEMVDMLRTMTFGRGKRVCAGTVQVSLVVCTVIARLIQEFECKLASEEEESIDMTLFTTHKLLPWKALLTARSNHY